MRLLFIGDIFGKPGRRAVARWLPDYLAREGADFVLANAENAAGGKGLTEPVAEELFALGIGALTGGNHTFHHSAAYSFFDREPRVLRPANLAPGVPGHGTGVYALPGGYELAVLNLQGRAFMKPVDCPFRAADAWADEARRVTPNLLVDFHAEATSEKVAMAAWLDGRATAVVGTHTHVQTADARVSEAGTAAITDVGMSGPRESIIGVDRSIVLDQLIVGMPVRHQVAKGAGHVCAVRVEFDPATGRASAIQAIQTPEWPGADGRTG